MQVTMEDCGLGPLPWTVTSVSSMLLYNSSINLYKEYATQDNLLDAAYDRRWV